MNHRLDPGVDKPKLAVICRHIGVPSETFIHKHIDDLYPGKTVAICQFTEPAWQARSPSLVLEPHAERSIRTRLLAKLGLKRRNQHALKMQKAQSFLEEHKITTLMVEYLDLSTEWMSIAKKMGLRIFPHAHGYDVFTRLRQKGWPEKYRRLEDSDGVILVSEHSRNHLVELGLNKEKLHVVPCGVVVQEKIERSEENAIVRCLAVGRMVRKKGPLDTLEAFRQASAKNPSLRLDFVGGGYLFEQSDNFVRSHGLTNVVTLHGVKSHDFVMRRMREADMFIQHSVTDAETHDQEGLPVAVLEAMAHTLPVVSTVHAGIPEAVVHGVTGLLVAEHDTCGMSDGILSLAEDGKSRVQFGSAGWLRVKERFSWEAEREKLLAIMGLNGA